MIKEDLHILMLEDEPLDAELNKAQLALLDEYNCIVHWVTDKKSYLEALYASPTDIILSDYNLPQYNGLDALRDLKAINQFIPFIFVTGAIDEETAANTIKAGAWDYVVKDRLFRLPLAIRGALKLREEKINTAMAESQSQKLLKAIEQSPVNVIICNIEGIIEYVNTRFTEVTGYKSEEVINKNIQSFIPLDSHNELAFNTWEKLKIGTSWRGEIQNTKKDGTLFWEYLSISPIKDKYGKITHFVAIKEDITHRKLLEHELIKARDNAQQSDKLKDAFLQNLSHEIRTPLNAIVGFSNLLSNSAELTPDAINNYTSIIRSSSNQLLSIVTDVLTIASIQTKQTTVNFHPVDVNKMFDDLYIIFSRQALEKKIELRFIKDITDKQLLTITDETKLIQIITNLLNNAIKFTKDGFVELKYTLQKGNIIFSVKDTGIGIAKESQEIIFERFRQATTNISIDYGGTGLGLSISKSFSEMLGGNLWVESEPNRGAKFFLSIPFSSHKMEQNNEITKQNLLTNSPVTILVAEDEINNYHLIEAILSLKNITLLYAQNGKDAIKICEKTPQINLILMDIKMPVMDGINALKEIRKIRNNLPVIAQTAYALEQDKQRFIEIGFTDYILKPIKKEELLEKINKAIFVRT